MLKTTGKLAQSPTSLYLSLQQAWVSVSQSPLWKKKLCLKKIRSPPRVPATRKEPSKEGAGATLKSAWVDQSMPWRRVIGDGIHRSMKRTWHLCLYRFFRSGTCSKLELQPRRYILNLGEENQVPNTIDLVEFCLPCSIALYICSWKKPREIDRSWSWERLPHIFSTNKTCHKSIKSRYQSVGTHPPLPAISLLGEHATARRPVSRDPRAAAPHSKSVGSNPMYFLWQRVTRWPLTLRTVGPVSNIDLVEFDDRLRPSDRFEMRMTGVMCILWSLHTLQ